MADQLEETIFREGSTTYYWSSKFFPAAVRRDVFKLYSFVRIADNYIDEIPQQAQAFYALRKLWSESYADSSFSTDPVDDDSVAVRVVKNMVYVSRKYAFEPKWIEAFLDAMQSDLERKQYRTIDDTIVYMHGSAEVIGLMMCKIMGIDPAAYPAAMLQGRAMQYINFIRDIAEDTALGRCYMPLVELRKFGLDNLGEDTAMAHPEAFRTCVHAQLDRYAAWQSEAEEGYRYLPRRLRIPVRTAAQMYDWTANEIRKDPFQIYRHKVKPTKKQVLAMLSAVAAKG